MFCLTDNPKTISQQWLEIQPLVQKSLDNPGQEQSYLARLDLMLLNHRMQHKSFRLSPEKAMQLLFHLHKLQETLALLPDMDTISHQLENLNLIFDTSPSTGN